MHDVHNRAPFIITREHQSAWLNPELNDPAEVTELLVPASASEIVKHPVSRAVGNARNQGAALIAPVVEARGVGQAGLDFLKSLRPLLFSYC